MSEEKPEITSETEIGAGGFTLGELGRNLERCFSSEPKVAIPCRRCSQLWAPGVWNFYNLCDSCFSKFNEQKMQGRWSRLAKVLDPTVNTPETVNYTESCEQWMKRNPYIKEDPS